MEPFLKWAGGKRWLARRELFKPDSNMRWIEPFAGSAAMFFHLEPPSALIADSNKDLINTYIVIRDMPDEFELRLRGISAKTSINEYKRVRSSSPRNEIDRAVRFVYLNRLAWNGLYRVNKKGEFNVPKGSKDNVILPTDRWQETSNLLKRATLASCDFEEAIASTGRGDFLFVDPPYTVAHNKNGFLKYNEEIFSVTHWEQPLRLQSDAGFSHRLAR